MAQFKSFFGQTDKGTYCLVINEGELLDGTAAYKVRLAKYVGYGGDHTPIMQLSVGAKTGYIAKSKVNRVKRAEAI